MNNRSIGVLLLCFWLICEGAIAVLHLNFTAIDIILGIVAIAAGVLILIGK